MSGDDDEDPPKSSIVMTRYWRFDLIKADKIQSSKSSLFSIKSEKNIGNIFYFPSGSLIDLMEYERYF